ncbi:MAG: hypothetical protein MUF49_05245 [Oculatellaceae cyanobacterium Prado106]|jgi:hypothetical protein|nr:hypothetical protein [Oculatellaceae cyanobacterium Prado106]
MGGLGVVVGWLIQSVGWVCWNVVCLTLVLGMRRSPNDARSLLLYLLLC